MLAWLVILDKRNIITSFYHIFIFHSDRHILSLGPCLLKGTWSMKLVGKMRKTEGHIISAFAVLRKLTPTINQSLSKCIECIFDHWTATVNQSVKCPFIIMLGIAQDCFIHGDGWVGGYEEEVGFYTCC